MARGQIGNQAGVAATSAGGGTNPTNFNGGGNNAESTGHWDADYSDITAMRARLAAIDAVQYTDAYLDTLTMNDMVYAIRLNDSPDTIKDT